MLIQTEFLRLSHILRNFNLWIKFLVDQFTVSSSRMILSMVRRIKVLRSCWRCLHWCGFHGKPSRFNKMLVPVCVLLNNFRTRFHMLTEIRGKRSPRFVCWFLSFEVVSSIGLHHRCPWRLQTRLSTVRLWEAPQEFVCPLFQLNIPSWRLKQTRCCSWKSLPMVHLCFTEQVCLNGCGDLR